MALKIYKFLCDSAVVLIKSEDEDNAWEMLEELVDEDRYDEFLLDDRDDDVQKVVMFRK